MTALRCLKGSPSGEIGWWCSRDAGHDGPCALRQMEGLEVGEWRPDGGLSLEEPPEWATAELSSAQQPTKPVERFTMVLLAAISYALAMILLGLGAGLGMGLYRWLS